MDNIWNETTRLLSSSLTPTAMETWLSGVSFVAFENSNLVISAPSELVRQVLESRFSPMIKDALKELMSQECELTVLCGDEAVQNYLGRRNFNEAAHLQAMDNYVFDRFVVGSSNEFAYKASKMVAENPGRQEHNTLIIYSNPCLGKTHLLYSIGQYIQKQNPDKNILFIKANDFTNQLIAALQERKMDEFRAKFRKADVLLIDDIQFIAGKQSTQEEVFNTFNAIYESGRQIVLTSDRPPKEMALLEQRLRSRFEGGIMAEIQKPDKDLRIALVNARAKEYGLELSDANVQLIAENITSNVRQIEGIMKNLAAYNDILGYLPDNQIKKSMESIVSLDVPRLTPSRIIRETARYFNVTEEDIRGASRARKQSGARQVAMYLMRSMTDMCMQDIGREFDGKDHATVTASVQKITNLLGSDVNIKSAVSCIKTNISASAG